MHTRDGKLPWRQSGGCDGVVLLLLFGLVIAILLTNTSFSVMDDEAFQVGSAAQPIGTVIGQFKTSETQLHPPLPDVMLHAWLRLTRNSLGLLRIPSTVFLVVGIWLSSLAAKRLAGDLAGRATVMLGVLWPYGFHFGRYAIWLSFCFFLLAALLYAYLCWLEDPNPRRFCAFVALATALLYTNYMGWAFLFVLGVDFLCRTEIHSRRHRLQAPMFAGVLCLCYLPVWPGLLNALRYHHAFSAKSLLMFVYSYYVLFASEAIAPWIFVLSIPIIVSILACSLVILIRGPQFARVLYVSSVLLGLALALSGEINQRRVMPLAAWMLTASGICIATVSPRWRRLLTGAFAIIGIFSWFGIMSQGFYATPRVFEPWEQIADASTSHLLAGDTIIASHPAFLFYLTRDVMRREGASLQEFRGNYGEQIERSGIYNVRDWISSSHPTSLHALFVATLYGTDFEPTIEASEWLDHHCVREKTEKFEPNPDFHLKAKFFGPSQGSPWRIEVRKYRCDR